MSSEIAALLDNPACAIDDRLVEGADGFSIRVISFTPNDGVGQDRPPILFIPGWTSVIEGWTPLLAAWSEQRVIHYIETREKNTAIAPKRRLRPDDFSIDCHIADFASVCSALGVDMASADWFASSLGSSAVLEGLKDERLSARSVFAIAPNAAFKFPLWAAPLTWMPWWLYPPIIRGIALPYLRWKLREEGQRTRYTRTLRNADVFRLKRSVQANKRFVIWPNIERITAPIAIAMATSDTLHAGDAAVEIAAAIPNATLIEVPSNQYTHEPEVIADHDAWANAL